MMVKIAMTDRRLLIIYLLLVAILLAIVTFDRVEAQRIDDFTHKLSKASQIRCVALDTSYTKINKVIDQLALNVKNSTALTPDQKVQALMNYQDLHLPILDCSGFASP